VSAAGSDVRRIEVPTPDGALPTLVASPRLDATPGPGLLLVHDVLGLSDDVSAISRRLAGDGFVVSVPGYFGEGRLVPCVVRAMRTLRRGHGPHFARLQAAWDHLRSLPEVDPDRIGVVGFCLGGGFALLWGARADATAVACFYGDVPRDPDALRGLPPCVAGYGGRDLVFARQGRRLRSHLERLGVEHDVVEYPAAGHAYLNRHDHLLMRLSGWGPTRAGYDPAAAEDSWQRMLSFFAVHLAGPPD
jgi:carboxymethylenebutenolidase